MLDHQRWWLSDEVCWNSTNDCCVFAVPCCIIVTYFLNQGETIFSSPSPPLPQTLLLWWCLTLYLIVVFGNFPFLSSWTLTISHLSISHLLSPPCVLSLFLCITAFLSSEWIEFVPFSANNNRQSGDLQENKSPPPVPVGDWMHRMCVCARVWLMRLRGQMRNRPMPKRYPGSFINMSSLQCLLNQQEIETNDVNNIK